MASDVSQHTDLLHERRTTPIDKHGGHVSLVDVMPRLVPHGRTADVAIVQAARVSYGTGTKRVSQDDALIDYLLRHEHWTPFEMVTFKFHVKCPLFVARQWLRHRTASVNEVSARYSVVEDTFYVPSVPEVRCQSTQNKQCSDGPADKDAATQFVLDMSHYTKATYNAYTDAIGSGVTREQARTILPQAVYTEFYWQTNLRNLLHFLRLRMDDHAQAEIHAYADAMYDMCRPIAPTTFASFDNHVREAITLSAAECSLVAQALSAQGQNVHVDASGLSARSKRELDAKLQRLGLSLGTDGI